MLKYFIISGLVLLSRFRLNITLTSRTVLNDVSYVAMKLTAYSFYIFQIDWLVLSHNSVLVKFSSISFFHSLS